MNKDELVDELYWDIIKAGFNTENEELIKLLQEAYDLGFSEGLDTAKDYE